MTSVPVDSHKIIFEISQRLSGVSLEEMMEKAFDKGLAKRVYLDQKAHETAAKARESMIASGQIKPLGI